MSVTVNASNQRKFSPSDRERYLKILLSESEMKVYDHKMQKINFHLKENGFVLNTQEFFRTLFLNLDDPDLINVMTKLYQKEVSPIFGYSKATA